MTLLQPYCSIHIFPSKGTNLIIFMMFPLVKISSTHVYFYFPYFLRQNSILLNLSFLLTNIAWNLSIICGWARTYSTNLLHMTIQIISNILQGQRMWQWITLYICTFIIWWCILRVNSWSETKAQFIFHFFNLFQVLLHNVYANLYTYHKICLSKATLLKSF